MTPGGIAWELPDLRGAGRGALGDRLEGLLELRLSFGVLRAEHAEHRDAQLLRLQLQVGAVGQLLASALEGLADVVQRLVGSAALVPQHHHHGGEAGHDLETQAEHGGAES